MTERSRKTGGDFPSPFVQEIIDFFEGFLGAERTWFYREIQGFRYWHYIRFQYYEKLCAGKGWIRKVSRREHTSIWNRLKIVAELARNSFRYNVKKDCTPAELLVLNSPSKVRIGDEWTDPYTGPLLENIPHAFSIWEDGSYYQHAVEEKHTENLYYFDRLHVEGFFKKGVSSSWRRTIREEAGFLAEAARQFGGKVPREEIARLIERPVWLYRNHSDTIRRKLLQKKIKCLLLFCHYEPLRMLVASIAKSLGIYTVEVQHGSMGRYHVGYNFHFKDRLDTLPDEIFTFGRYWNETTRIAGNGVRLTPTGMPYVEERMRRLSPPDEHDKTRVLMVSQATIGGQLGEMALGLRRLLDPEQYEIVYKLHPREFDSWRLTYPEGFPAPGIRVEKATDLYDLLNETDIHVGVYSTVVIESLLFNKPLILVESYGAHYFTHLIEKGRARFARNAEEIAAAVEGFAGSSSAPMDATHYWESDSLRKMRNRIDEILGA